MHGTTNIKIENEINVSDIIDAESINEYEENESSLVGDIMCEFGRQHVNTTYPPAEVQTVYRFNQELWNNFIFGQVNYQKFDSHIQELVNSIIKNNKLKPITQLSELCFSQGNIEITISGSLKMTKKELFLSSPYGNIKLDLSEASHPILPLFVNQILVLTGTNPDTKVFKVRKVFSKAPLPLPKILPTFTDGNINLIVAAGPFFTESSPHGKSLKSIIQKMIEFKSQVLILLGPIFETDFGTQLNKTSSDSLQKCYDDVLESIFKPLFSDSTSKHPMVLILSSWKDTSNYAFYPTPPNSESKLPILYPNHVFMLSDPSVFSINDILIASNTCDTLMGLHVSAINQKKGDIFSKLAKQIVWQRCLHPSYIANPTVPVDQLLWLEHCTLKNNTPHIILTSSQLRPFIRIAECCMVINVGQLIKHNSQNQAITGTYGKIQIAPPKNNSWSPETNIFVEIIHI